MQMYRDRDRVERETESGRERDQVQIYTVIQDYKKYLNRFLLNIKNNSKNEQFHVKKKE